MRLAIVNYATERSLGGDSSPSADANERCAAGSTLQRHSVPDVAVVLVGQDVERPVGRLLDVANENR
jgi:hypothetical protein